MATDILLSYTSTLLHPAKPLNQRQSAINKPIQVVFLKGRKMNGKVQVGQESQSQCWLLKPDSCPLNPSSKVRGMRGTLKINSGLGRIRKKKVGD